MHDDQGSCGDSLRDGSSNGSRTFANVWEVASTFDGWLTTDQAHALWDAASSRPEGAVIVEIGSHQGRSTAVLAAAAENLNGVVTAIDPFEDPRWGGGRRSREIFFENLTSLNLVNSTVVIEGFSTSERGRWSGPIDLLYIDGAHDFSTVCDDLKWASFLPSHGLVAVHDGFSSVGVTRALLGQMLLSDRLRYVRRVGSLVWFVKETPTNYARMRLTAQTPWFLRNLLVKVALRREWPRALRLLKHEGTACPY